MLRARGWRPLHRLGQNFLVRADILDQTTALAGIQTGELVLEVGPGLGGLTERLLDAGARVLAVELDGGYRCYLQELFAGRPGFRLLAGDVLATKSALNPAVQAALDAERRGGPFKLVSNLPYQISSPLLSALAPMAPPPALCVVMLQREVSSVLRARPGHPDYSPLSFLSALYYEVAIERIVPPGAFHPPPKVESAVVRLIPREHPAVRAEDLLPWARLLFQKRRKALRSTVPWAFQTLGWDGVFASDLFDRAGIDPASRVDGVAPEDLARLFSIYSTTGASRGN